MPTADLALPTGEKVRLVFLRKYPNLGDMIYLQSSRSGRMKDDSAAAQSYKNMATIYAGQLAATVTNRTATFDALIAAPSSRHDTDVYRDAIVLSSGLRDLTTGFSRKGKIKAATAKSVEEVINEFDYAPTGSEAKIKSLLIVDESVASGKTLAAVLHHLRKAGLSKDCQITVVVAAWLVE
jgi:uracil phosphoribosyltransferase